MVTTERAAVAENRDLPADVFRLEYVNTDHPYRFVGLSELVRTLSRPEHAVARVSANPDTLRILRGLLS